MNCRSAPTGESNLVAQKKSPAGLLAELAINHGKIFRRPDWLTIMQRLYQKFRKSRKPRHWHLLWLKSLKLRQTLYWIPPHPRKKTGEQIRKPRKKPKFQPGAATIV